MIFDRDRLAAFCGSSQCQQTESPCVVSEALRLHLHLQAGLSDSEVGRALKISKSVVGKSTGQRLLAGWDEELLRVELDALQDEGFDLDITGFDADALAELMAGDEPDFECQTDEDAVPDVGETPISRPGDVWLLGKQL